MTFREFVQIGRIVMIVGGKYNGKIGTIVNVIDQNRILADGPLDVTGFPRKVVNLKRVRLTPFVVPIPHNCGHKLLREVIKKEKIVAKWQQSSMYKKIRGQERRKEMNDFDRFKAMVTKMNFRNVVLKHEKKMKAWKKRDMKLKNKAKRDKVLAKSAKKKEYMPKQKNIDARKTRSEENKKRAEENKKKVEERVAKAKELLNGLKAKDKKDLNKKDKIKMALLEKRVKRADRLEKLKNKPKKDKKVTKHLEKQKKIWEAKKQKTNPKVDRNAIKAKELEAHKKSVKVGKERKAKLAKQKKFREEKKAERLKEAHH